MNQRIATAAVLTFASFTALASAATADAAPTGSSSAADVVQDLKAQGYDVQLNGQPDGSLAQCTVTGVHRASSTVYVDIDCVGND